MHYSLGQLERLLGISRQRILRWVREGIIIPTRGMRNEYRFGFRDMVVLRTVHGPRRDTLPTRRLMRALRSLRARLPADLPLSSLRLQLLGTELTVREGDARWSVESGQWLLDLDTTATSSEVRCLAAPAAAIRDGVEDERDADAWFVRALSLQAKQPAQAETAYRRALDIDAGHVSAYLNLGAMLLRARRVDEAIVLYARAIEACPDEVLILFDFGLALEEAGHPQAALEQYRQVIALAPDFTDAHSKAARLDGSMR